ncbi:MAG: hypothetical protein HC896_05350 [Bacteroidales bacterium]|nr:hypothetical protein [Bacteroidales bacterium]
MYYNSKPDYLLSTASYIKHTQYNDKCFEMGAGYFPYGGWGGGDYQIVSWKLLSQVDPGEGKTVQFLSGIGMQSPSVKYYKYGNMRSPFDQLAHHKNVLIQMTKVPANANDLKITIKALFSTWQTNWQTDFDERFPNDNDRQNPVNFQDLSVSENASYIILANQGTWASDTLGNIIFLELEKTIVAIRSLRNELPLDFSASTNTDFKYTKVSAPKDQVCGYILEAFNKEGISDLAAFKTGFVASTQLNNDSLNLNDSFEYLSYAGDKIKVYYQDKGSFTEPVFDWGYGFQEPLVVQTSPPIMQPSWPSGKGHGKLANGT